LCRCALAQAKRSVPCPTRPQVAVTGADISLYATGAVTYFVLGLDLTISFCVVLYQTIIRNVPLEPLPDTLDRSESGQITLSSRFLDDDEGAEANGEEA